MLTIFFNMRTVGKKLASREEAIAYNSALFESQAKWGGCTASRACPECLHVISDSICCCMGLGTCDNCGHKDPKFITPPAMPIGEPRDFANYYVVNPQYQNGFQYVGDWPKNMPLPTFTTLEYPKFEVPKIPIPRAEVYDAIDGERDYQNKQWSGPDHQHEVGAYITLLAAYVQKAQTAWTDKSGDYDALHVIRKIAGIAVHCMEEHGAPKRGEVINQDGEKIQTAN